MRRHLVPFAGGFALASAIFCVVLARYGGGQLQTARTGAATQARADILARIPETFGDDYRASDGYTVFFEVKTDAAVVVERNGVKTLRRYVEGRE